ncbi:MAG: hypothetical protein AB7V01_05690 [Vicinamibacterales bacterium]
MGRRKLTEDEVLAVIEHPDQSIVVRPGCVLLQSVRRVGVDEP